MPFVFNGGIVLIAFLFSAMAGVIFGYFPAFEGRAAGPDRGLKA
jgi:putative ABC transport system permease protein